MQQVNPVQKIPEELAQIVGECTLRFGALEHELKNSIKSYKAAFTETHKAPEEWKIERSSYSQIHHEDYKNWNLGNLLNGMRPCDKCGNQTSELPGLWKLCNKYHENDRSAEIFQCLEKIKTLNTQRNEYIHALFDAESGQSQIYSKEKLLPAGINKFKELHDQVCVTIQDLNRLRKSIPVHITKSPSMQTTTTQILIDFNQGPIICETSAASSMTSCLINQTNKSK